jgi:hypothetical protein
MQDKRKSNAHLYQQKSTHITGYQTFTRRKNILPRHGRINTNSEDWRKKLEVFPLRKPSTD